MKLAVFLDFDDTVTVQNVAHSLFKRFIPEPAAKYTAMYRSGEITFREYQEKSFNAIDVPLELIQEAAALETTLRPGFDLLVRRLQQSGSPVTIVSAGLDLYIRPVLERAGFGALTLVCASATQNGTSGDRFRYDYSAGSGTCSGDWATCKCAALESAERGAATVFVGDGSTSDVCAARKADYVFARERLLKHCRENGTTATPFEDFFTIAEFVAHLIDSQPAGQSER